MLFRELCPLFPPPFGGARATGCQIVVINPIFAPIRAFVAALQWLPRRTTVTVARRIVEKLFFRIHALTVLTLPAGASGRADVGFDPQVFARLKLTRLVIPTVGHRL